MPADPASGGEAFRKRVRRRVTARRWDFFAAVSPGFEKVCLKECRSEAFLRDSSRPDDGGIAFSGRVEAAYRANLAIRTCGRVLMRIGGFKASNFGRLEKKLSDFPWELFLPAHAKVRAKISSARSRLYHTGAVEERFAESWRSAGFDAAPGSAGEDSASFHTVYVRIVDDFLTISADGSGESLYKRGLKTQGGPAPLRETAAAAILALAGYTGREPLIDPMCGTGTFSLEAAMIAQGIPPGWFREFGFFRWPCFSPGKWRHIRREFAEKIRHAEKPSVFASDSNREVCGKLAALTRKADLGNAITVEEGGRDFFGMRPGSLVDGTGVVVLNPPYGLRMEIGGEDALSFYGEIFEKLRRDFGGWKAAVVAPCGRTASLAPSGMRRARFFHGGLELFLVYGRIP